MTTMKKMVIVKLILKVGTWDLETGFKSDLELEPVKRFFRVRLVDLVIGQCHDYFHSNG